MAGVMSALKYFAHTRTFTALVIAVGVDLHAWNSSDAPFNWKVALKRWIVAAFGGFTLDLGLGVN